MNENLSKSKSLYDTPQDSPVKETADPKYLSWKDQLVTGPRYLIGVLEEVKETSGIEVME